jgi:hypothetical protein
VGAILPLQRSRRCGQALPAEALRSQESDAALLVGGEYEMAGGVSVSGGCAAHDRPSRARDSWAAGNRWPQEPGELLRATAGAASGEGAGDGG